MSNVFFISDTHFSHKNVITFEKSSRPFDTIEEHDEFLIQRWNSVVTKRDLVYHLGDVYLGKKPDGMHEIFSKLNGRKVLVRGNHDLFPASEYLKVFEDVCGVVGKYGFVMSHVPLDPRSVQRWGANVHGHLHSNKVTNTSNACPYVCVSVEQTELAPVALSEVLRRIEVCRGQDQKDHC